MSKNQQGLIGAGIMVAFEVGMLGSVLLARWVGGIELIG